MTLPLTALAHPLSLALALSLLTLPLPPSLPPSLPFFFLHRLFSKPLPAFLKAITGFSQSPTIPKDAPFLGLHTCSSMVLHVYNVKVCVYISEVLMEITAVHVQCPILAEKNSLPWQTHALTVASFQRQFRQLPNTAHTHTQVLAMQLIT